MRELSLFTGAGGGLLGTKLLGWEHIGYVEWNEYCQQVIAARIRDGYLPISPIFTDVREFVQSGAAEQYRGIADVVSAGFPCQPFSVAGKQAGADDERNMWPATADVIRIVHPQSVLLENVPGLISSGYFGTVIGDLADMGYVGRWGVISASDCGAPHKRSRIWIVGHSASQWLNVPRGTLMERAESGRALPLSSQVALKHWPTPTASDHRDRGGPSTPAVQRREQIGKSIELSMRVDGALNPDWVEWLMGWPIGWTDLKPLEMVRFQAWLDAHGSASA